MKRLEVIKNKIIENKKEIYIYMIISIICLITCSPLLQMHIASDTYNLMDLGYLEYPNEFFLKDGRILSTVLVYIAGILNLNYEIFIILGSFASIIITSISIYTLYKMIVEKIENNNSKIKLLIILSTFIIIFNAITLEYLIYAESSIMCLSVLFSILGVKQLLSNKKKSYIKSLILIIIATFSYQGSVNIYITLTLLMLFIDKTKTKKEIIKIFMKSISIFVISFVINVLTIYILNFILLDEQNRIAQGGILYNINNFAEKLALVLVYSLVTNYNIWPIGITPITIIITILVLTYKNNDKKEQIKIIIRYILLVVIAIGVCVAPIFLMKNPSLEPRMAMSIGSIIGISIIYLIVNTQNSNKMFKKTLEIVIIIFFVYNTVNCLNLFNIHVITNKIDQNQALAIKYKIEKYEKETNNKITKVAYYKDASYKAYHYGYNHNYSSFSQRAFDNYYCIIEALNYYCDRKFEKTSMDKEIYLEFFKDKDWDTFTEEQIVFEGDTMYICTY